MSSHDQSGGDPAADPAPSQSAGIRKLLVDRVRGGSLGRDLRAGLVLGIESVPDGLAQGLLAGVNPIFGLHGYMVGTAAGALATSSTFMAVQATGAMSLAFVGLVQGAGISASFPNADGSFPDPSRDFVGQGVGNVASGNVASGNVAGDAGGGDALEWVTRRRPADT